MKHLELFTQSLPCCDLDVQVWFCKFKSLLPGYLPAFPLLLLSCLLMCFEGFVGISEQWNTVMAGKQAPSLRPHLKVQTEARPAFPSYLTLKCIPETRD